MRDYFQEKDERGQRMKTFKLIQTGDNRSDMMTKALSRVIGVIASMTPAPGSDSEG